MSYVKVNNNFRSFDGLMKDLFNEFPSAVSKVVREDVLHYPPVNILDKTNSYAIEFNVPGYEKSDFNVKLENNLLTVSADKKENAPGENEKTVRKEFALKSFRRSFTIDEKIETENISARYENGILKLELPKKENLNAGVKDISIQ